ncbi:succinate dehydrogenase cytochrome b560 subunit, mitochondrial-like [Paramacrobiotus metropolitanus]|uniref:succinate dehydrogenase cytochrome b560 subunit, mitochondrial-like n=1 Tax=Paramacrobiotus metropolitanus TaxID=2943436 RepID=UPI0024457A79|nr:succinate dehydrogenase cytochrome b560 subunit, mitochondrial-like [Paramacrobiotus metropolitanus]
MLALANSALRSQSVLWSSLRSMRTSSTILTEKFRGTPKSPPDTDKGEKYTPSDFRESAGSGVPRSGDDFFDRNKKLNRPLSPHLTIYQTQLPMMMSGTHRATGLILGLQLGVVSLGILLAPQHFDYYVEVIRSWQMNDILVFVGKFGVGWLLMYHYFNGIRHLAWDMGKGFALPDLYKTGYVVLALSLLSAAYLATQ